MWTGFDELHRGCHGRKRVRHRPRKSGRGIVTWRLTHAYPDVRRLLHGHCSRLPWARDRAMDRHQGGGVRRDRGGGRTTTHHHAVGRTHVPWFERERRPTYLDALRSTKRALDPAGIINPACCCSASLQPSPSASRRFAPRGFRWNAPSARATFPARSTSRGPSRSPRTARSSRPRS